MGYGTGQGGWVATPNVDICRAARRDPAVRALIGQASLTVADGMPLLWAARLRGTPLPERVTGASLIFSISAAAARHGQSVYLLGGEPGVPERAAEQLIRRCPGLRVAGTDAPPFGFDATERGVAQLRDRLTEARPDVVFVGLGCPKQERLITRLARPCPRPGSSPAALRYRSPPGRCNEPRTGCSERAWSGRTGWPASHGG